MIKQNNLMIIFLILFLCFMNNGEAASLSFHWQELKPIQSPPSRRFAAMAFDPRREQLILFGGYNGRFLNDTWAYDAKANTWINLAPITSPPIRAGAAMTYDYTAGQMILFGGYGGDHYRDTWAYDAQNNKWVNQTPPSRFSTLPPARAFASFAYDPKVNLIVLFGGENGRELRDSWTYDAKSNKWMNITPSSIPADYPPARYGAAMVFNPETNQLILIGGGNEEWSFNDMWTLDAKAHFWKRLNPLHSPPALEFAAFSVDPINSEFLLFGGSDSDASHRETWRYDFKGNSWQQLYISNTSPSERYGASMAYDPLNRRSILFGGNNKGYLGDTWSFHAESEKVENVKND